MRFFDDPKNTTGRLTGRLATDAAMLHGSLGERVALNFREKRGVVLITELS